MVCVDLVSKHHYSGNNIFAMRLGPGKHLKGRTLLGGVIAPEEFDCFHEVRLNVFRF